MSRLLLPGFLLLLESAWPGEAQAQAVAPQPSTGIELDRCLRASPEEVRRVLAIELDQPVTAGVEAVAEVVASVSCEGEEAAIQVSAPWLEGGQRRSLSLSGESEATRDRVLALAIAEAIILVRAQRPEVSRAERHRRDADEATPTPDRAPEASVDPPDRGEDQPRGDDPRPDEAPALPLTQGGRALSLRLTGHLLWSRPWLGGGAGLQMDHWPGRYLGWGLSLDLDGASIDSSLGPVEMLWLSIAPSLLGGFPIGRWRLWGGVAFRIGYSRMEGTPRVQRVDGAVTHGAWGGPAILVGARVRLRGPLEVGLSAELGYALVTHRALVSGVESIASEGLWIGLQLHIGLAASRPPIRVSRRVGASGRHGRLGLGSRPGADS